MGKLYKRLAAVYLVSAVLFILVFAVSLYFRLREENGYYLYQLLGSVDSNLDRITEEYEENAEETAEQYVKYARETAFIIAGDEKLCNRADLEKIRELMNVGAISLIDFSGRIVLSTDRQLEGIQEEEQIMEMFRTQSAEDPCAVRRDDPDFWGYPEYLYAVVPAETEKFAAVRVDGDMEGLRLSSGADRVETVLKQATTEYNTSIFAAGKARGRIIGITENNSQDIRIDQVQEGTQMLDFLSGLQKGKPLILRVNGKYQSVVVREREDMYLAAFTGMDQLVSDVLVTVVTVLSVIAVISTVTIIMLRLYIRKYMFGYFEQISAGIHEVLRGEKTFTDRESVIPELKLLRETIARLEQEYVSKSENMERIADELSAAKNEAEYDHLTGLYNRNGFERRMNEFLKGEKICGALILFDLDNFKQVNDMAGHPAGDRLLAQFAGCLSGAFRSEDVIGRLGGDEFVVLIRGEMSERVLQYKFNSFFDELRKNLRESYARYKVSASAGAVMIDGTVCDYQTLYQRADQALYISKYQGKDRYYISPVNKEMEKNKS